MACSEALASPAIIGSPGYEDEERFTVQSFQVEVMRAMPRPRVRGGSQPRPWPAWRCSRRGVGHKAEGNLRQSASVLNGAGCHFVDAAVSACEKVPEYLLIYIYIQCLREASHGPGRLGVALDEELDTSWSTALVMVRTRRPRSMVV